MKRSVNCLLMRFSVLFVALFCGQVSYAQSNVETPSGSVRIVKEVKPPILQLQGKVEFADPNGNNAIDAGESCTLAITVANSGMGDGYGLKGTIRTAKPVAGVSFGEVSIPVVKVGATQRVVFPIQANMSTVDGTADFLIGIKEPNGFDLPEVPVTVVTRAFQAPMVEYRGHIVENGAVSMAKNTPYTFSVMVQNTGFGRADKVNAILVLPDGVYVLNEEGALKNATLESGESRTIKYSIIIPQAYSQATLPVTLQLSESYGRYSKNGSFSFDVREQRASDRIVVDANIGTTPQVDVVTLGSDVDRDIPRTNVVNGNLHVMIIANQNYRVEKGVATALSDGRMMREYCVRTLGVPDKNVKLLEDRTSAEMQAAVEDFARTIRYNPDDRFIFFYFGHGMRDNDPNVSDAYLVPVDGSSMRLKQTGLSRNWMMSQFEKSNPAQMVVYLESCFSGATPSDEMLAYSENSSGLRLSDDVPCSFKGNIILLTASSQSQTANAFTAVQHNVFTYEFLKALKENKGDVNWGTMFDNVKRSTERTAWNELARTQVPSVMVSTTLGDKWRQWRVK